MYIDDVLVLVMSFTYGTYNKFSDWHFVGRNVTTDVHYFGQVFSVRAINKWLIPSNVRDSLRTIGNPPIPINGCPTSLKKNAVFVWTPDCQAAFTTLKEKQMQDPVLVYPWFDSDALPFMLQTDASSVGVGAVLEQGCMVVAYDYTPQARFRVKPA